jgi:hypothetical protein
MDLITWSWIFLAVYIAFMLAIGLIGQRKVKHADDFATRADRTDRSLSRSHSPQRQPAAPHSSVVLGSGTSSGSRRSGATSCTRSASTSAS